MPKAKVEFVPDFDMEEPTDNFSDIESAVDNIMENPEKSDWEKEKRKLRCIIVDIDGTLANVTSSLKFDYNNKLNWKKFYGNIPKHPINGWCQRLVQIYYQMGFVVYIVSGRPADYREQTEEWLAKHNIPYDFLFTRAAGDFRQDDVVKKEILNRDLPNKKLIEFVVDDRQRVVDMWRKEGLICLQCEPHAE